MKYTTAAGSIHVQEEQVGNKDMSRSRTVVFMDNNVQHYLEYDSLEDVMCVSQHTRETLCLLLKNTLYMFASRVPRFSCSKIKNTTTTTYGHGGKSNLQLSIVPSQLTLHHGHPKPD